MSVMRFVRRVGRVVADFGREVVGRPRPCTLPPLPPREPRPADVPWQTCCPDENTHLWMDYFSGYGDHRQYGKGSV